MTYAKARKIFIVDDNELQLTALADFLAMSANHQIATFTSGPACMNRMNENPDVVVLDYNLDSVDRDAPNGMKVLEQIKKHHPNVHVIILSGQEKYAVALQTIQKGAAHYVLKDDTAFSKVRQLIDSFS